MGEEQEPLLAARLQQSYAGFSLDVDFTLTHPWTVLFGPSAAGKSTLLRSLAGLVVPERGAVRLAGTTLFDSAARICLPPGRRAIGFVQQRPALFPHRTVAENIAFGLHALPARERHARVEEVLALLEIEPLRDRKPARLSGGEGQRVAIARAIAPRPRLLLLDEPLSALDAPAKPPILASLMRANIPVLYVSHDLAEIWNLPAHVLLMEAGRITASGPLRQVLAPQRASLLAQLS
jgi:molybdate transport system ATP-binding protein